MKMRCFILNLVRGLVVFITGLDCKYWRQRACSP